MTPELAKELLVRARDHDHELMRVHVVALEVITKLEELVEAADAIRRQMVYMPTTNASARAAARYDDLRRLLLGAITSKEVPRCQNCGGNTGAVVPGPKAAG